MKKLAIVLFLNAALLQGCGLFGTGEPGSDSGERTTPPAGEANQEQAENVQQQAQEEKKPDSPVVTPTKSIEGGIVATGLIPSTNPRIRMNEINQGRNDPFSLIRVEPAKIVYPMAQPEKPGAKVDSVTGGGSNGATKGFATSRGVTKGGASGVSGGRLSPDGSVVPPVLEPSLAKEVMITGVVKLNGTTQVILKAPEESYSRYVEIGQYVSNGQVLVKRIEFPQPEEPVIVLEQYGMEVYKGLGQTEVSAESLEQADLPDSSIIASSSKAENLGMEDEIN